MLITLQIDNNRLLLSTEGIIWLFPNDQRRPMMSNSQELYNHLNKKWRELVHVKNVTQMTNWIWIIVGMLMIDDLITPVEVEIPKNNVRESLAVYG